jgi:hypothetical protein
MRLSPNRTKTQGTVLLVTLLTAWVIGVSLVSYLTLVANQNRSSYHSLTWNTCVPVMEAGVEEALTQLHFNSVTNLTANDWILGANGLYQKRRFTGADGSYYEVTIQPVDPPVIFSSGYSAAPANTGQPMGGSSAFGMILGAVSGSLIPSTPAMVNRRVRVTTKRQFTGGGGLMAKDLIQFTGGNYLDSFDSSDPNYSTNGLYDPALRKDNAMALSNSKNDGAIKLAASMIYGSATTGPGGSVIVAGGTIGDAAWVASQSGLQDGHYENDANVQFDEVSAPFTFASGLTPIAGLVGGTNYAYVVDGAIQQNFNLTSATIDDTHPMIVIGNATLYIDGDLVVTGTGLIYLDVGASLKLYVGGSVDIGGPGIINGTSRAKNLSIYGLKTCTALNYSGTAPFIGTVYAPDAAFTFSGEAGAFGAFSANTITIGSGVHVAFDENLNATGEYVVASWVEF